MKNDQQNMQPSSHGGSVVSSVRVSSVTAPVVRSPKWRCCNQAPDGSRRHARKNLGIPALNVALAILLVAGCGEASDPDTSTATNPNREPAAQKPVEPPPGDDPPDSTQLDPTQLREQALIAFAAEDADTADGLSRKLVALNPNAPENVFLLGSVLAAQNRFAEAIHLLDGLAERVPETQLPVAGQSADWMVRNGQWTEAESRYKTILEAVPDAAEAHRKLAMLYLRQGRRLEARTHLHVLCRGGNIGELELRSMLKIAFPFRGDATIDRIETIGDVGMARSEVARGNVDVAIETLSKATGEPLAKSLLARIHAEKEDFEALLALSSEPPEAVSALADYWFARATSESHAGNHEAAIQSFRKVVLRDPTDQLAILGLNRSLAKQEMTQQATDLGERAELLRKTYTIGEAMAASPERTAEQIKELASSLDSLQRPFEALAWRAIQLSYAAEGQSQEETIRQMKQLNEQRLKLLESTDPDEIRQFTLSAIELNESQE